LNSSLAVAAVVFVMVLGLGAGYLGGTVNSATTTVTDISTQTSSTTSTVTQPVTTTITQSVTTTQSITTGSQSGGNVVNLVIVPDYGGATYDAFVKASNLNATAPVLATNSTGPGPNNNNVTVSAGVPVKFVITSIDTAVLMNFNGTVTTPFSFYNDTAAGVVGQQYSKGEVVSNLPIGHTFTITELGLNIPIPADTIVTFNYTFTKPGVYVYFCETPCGAGMTAPGYMIGYVIVT
jgi:heme/copper-type cytochrome/quinol oxidase subunit 2